MGNPFDKKSGPFQLRGVRLIDPAAGHDGVADLVVEEGRIQLLSGDIPGATIIDGTGLWAMPGLVDLQVHFRQPGFEYKETIETGSRAALAGGITSVVVMPNTKPALDTPEEVRFESEESDRVDGVRILVAAAVTKNLEGKELTDHQALRQAGAVAVTDDGLPVMDDAIMKASLEQCASNDLLFMQHAEDLSMTNHAPMTESPVSEKLGVAGQPAAAEGVMVERDIALAKQTGARYHVLHTSTARSLDAVRAAKAQGQRVTCEVSPHHLLLTYDDCATGDTCKKMNPPLRSEHDRQAVVAALVDGTADAVATDHAPHSAEEKAKSFADAPFGVTGLETAFAAVLEFVHRGDIEPTRAVELMTSGPARVLGLDGLIGTVLAEGAAADLCLVDPDQGWAVTEDSLHGKSKNTAFLNRRFRGRVVGTFMRGALRYNGGLKFTPG